MEMYEQGCGEVVAVVKDPHALCRSSMRTHYLDLLRPSHVGNASYNGTFARELCPYGRFVPLERAPAILLPWAAPICTEHTRWE